MREVCIITNHKSLVAILNRNVAMLSQNLQCIILRIQQDRVHINYKPGPVLYIVDWLFHNNHAENRDQEIAGMSVNVNVISTLVNKPVCMSIEDKQATTPEDAHL